MPFWLVVAYAGVTTTPGVGVVKFTVAPGNGLPDEAKVTVAIISSLVPFAVSESENGTNATFNPRLVNELTCVVKVPEYCCEVGLVQV